MNIIARLRNGRRFTGNIIKKIRKMSTTSVSTLPPRKSLNFAHFNYKEVIRNSDVFAKYDRVYASHYLDDFRYAVPTILFEAKDVDGKPPQKKKVHEREFKTLEDYFEHEFGAQERARDEEEHRARTGIIKPVSATLELPRPVPTPPAEPDPAKK